MLSLSSQSRANGLYSTDYSEENKMGIILFVVSLLLNIVLAIPGLIHTIAGAFRYRGKFSYVDAAFLRGAKALDIFGNVAYGTLLNDLLIEKGGYHFGQGSEKVSSAAGKNWAIRKLTPLGMGLVGFLNLIDWKNWKSGGHCWNAIEGEKEYYQTRVYPGPVRWYYTTYFTIVTVLIVYPLIRLCYWLFILLTGIRC